MVITTPFVTKSILNLKPYNRLFTPTASSITIKVTEKGCKYSSSWTFTDIDCMKKRICIGRVSNRRVQIDDRKVSRLHAVIECSMDGVWTFTDLQSLNGSIVNGKTLKPKTPYKLEHKDLILISRIRWKLCHEMYITLHYLIDDLPKEAPPPPPRKLTWRRSLYCNGCMGFGPRHSCSMRHSVLQKMILNAYRKSNLYAPRPGKTLLQNAVMKRMSYWWPKQQEKKEKLSVPGRYENEIDERVQALPDYGGDSGSVVVQYPLFNKHVSI